MVITNNKYYILIIIIKYSYYTTTWLVVFFRRVLLVFGSPRIAIPLSPRSYIVVDNIRAMVGTTGLRNAQFHPASRKGDGKNVLVVLIGWWLAKEKHLAKYLPIWHENGCATVSFVPNFLDSDFSRMAEAMMDNLAAYLEKEPDTIIIFHVFSNNGVLCLIKSLGFSRKSKRHAEVHNAIFGCIFDSCPGYLSVLPFNAFLAANKQSFLSGFVFKCICYALLGWLSMLFFDVNHVPIYLMVRLRMDFRGFKTKNTMIDWPLACYR